ncbi:hypothetical protein B0T10DRAFT_495197 [Thelonectria olida]|uniref:Uncharacterized protein n=1 Tax=Thelonectria olida TaxID=1576542 RepID=A0A9P8VZG8_9HYPO|nr:hypothetical protein B0T10DRAFT_495197 [Thelonectria olida]
MSRPLLQDHDDVPLADFSQRSSDIGGAYISRQAEESIYLTGLLNADANGAAESTPRARVEPKQDTSWVSKTRKSLAGWRVGALYFVLGALISLILNIVLAVWVPTMDSFRYGIGVLWGAIFVDDTGEGQDRVGHCCFTSSLVKRPKPGLLYAGRGVTCKKE